jgi:(R,R)-butanediol dehydrogenase/meso-butanediol dehydrogenase/diacetyl reductase
MRAVRWHARGDVRLDEVLEPVPGPTDVLIRIEAAAICGTDVDEVRLGPINVPVRPHPVSGRSAPVTLGHEMVGVVVATGRDAGLAAGARVAPWPSRPCGHCPDCVAGRANRCPRAVALGMSADGGMADFLVVDEGSCVPVGADVALERAVLVEPFAVALHGLHGLDLAGRRVAVVGVGSLGLCVLEAVVAAGAAEVVAVSRSEGARAAALAAGATTSVAPGDPAAARIAAEVVFETAGAEAALAASFAAVRRGGTIVVLGGHPRPLPLDLQDLVHREIAVRGSVSHCLADFAAAAAAISAGELARTPRAVELAPLEAGPDLLRSDATTAKRILLPARSPAPAPPTA